MNEQQTQVKGKYSTYMCFLLLNVLLFLRNASLVLLWLVSHVIICLHNIKTVSQFIHLLK